MRAHERGISHPTVTAWRGNRNKNAHENDSTASFGHRLDESDANEWYVYLSSVQWRSGATTIEHTTKPT